MKVLNLEVLFTWIEIYYNIYIYNFIFQHISLYQRWLPDFQFITHRSVKYTIQCYIEISELDKRTHLLDTKISMPSSDSLPEFMRQGI